MPTGLILFLCALISFLIGSISFCLLIARVFGGFDLRTRGSGNVGATNVGRTMGAKWGITALLLDAAKGALPVAFLPALLNVPEHLKTHAAVLCGVAAILGHMFSFFLQFKGGKGVATALGVVGVLAPTSMGIAFLSFVLAFAASRIVSLSSMVAAVAFAVAQFSLFGSKLWTPDAWSLGAFSVAIPLLIILKHQSNIVRLLKGEEKKFTMKSAEKSSESPKGPDSPAS
ncbi:glycerol-3-phosphate 1-O-acyltransferase PlsY [Planctomicrobium sp. SH668]|uniref:glycerol-3-phosphate 1-O-acyltransferase PlsY n=1 Tax=Planctomicrobium sp. SH668 TaxID=3448126 RepID=UPI003F5BA4EB